MNQPYIKPVFATYVAIMTILAFFSSNVKVKAEEQVEVIEEVQPVVYQLEMNHAKFDEIKKDVLSEDIKYILAPNELEKDIELSEVIAKDINYATYEKQEVQVDVVRYLDSNSEKIVKDVIQTSVVVQIVDTTLPEITLLTDEIKFEEGKSFNVRDYLMSVTDNSYGDLEISIDNPVDNEKPGEYTVVYSATDSSNNTAVAELLVKVTEKPKEEVKVEAKAPVAKKAASKPASVPVYAASGDAVSQTLSLINQHRANSGLAPLSLAGSLEMSGAATRAAEARSYVSHSRPDGRSYTTAFTDLGVYHSRVIEVMVYAGSSPADKVNWWMNSSAHRAALLRPSATHIAIGINGGMYIGLIY